jgi:hypothetical protein
MMGKGKELEFPEGLGVPMVLPNYFVFFVLVFFIFLSLRRVPEYGFTDETEDNNLLNNSSLITSHPLVFFLIGSLLFIEKKRDSKYNPAGIPKSSNLVDPVSNEPPKRKWLLFSFFKH